MAHARAALAAAAALDVSVTLISPRNFAAYGGAAYFVAMIRAAAEGSADVRYCAVLDCGRAAGHALAAFREGVACVSVRLPKDRRTRLQAIAKAYRAEVISPIRGGLDLAGAEDPERTCRAWLAPVKAPCS